ncbi:MAG: magnesium and cobalt transport protein CorA [Desulfobacterales bacterium CG2_30_60_27]|nr:MAG: magnesium and cobalt transport protein CorA [Desulfobacterales bacterium CG2_30_60_27]
MRQSYTLTSHKAGLSPGTAVYVGEKKTEDIRISLIDYDKDSFKSEQLANVEACAPYLNQETVTWINVDGLHDAILIEKLGSLCGLHPLTVEDILHTSQRPKIDVFDDYVYLVLRMHSFNREARKAEVEQVSFILGKNFLLTFQETSGDTFDAARERLAHNKGRIRKMGADYLAYALLDSVVDNYFAVLENIGEEVEVLEDALVVNPTPAILHNIHRLKRETIMLRKSVWPLREVINGLQREEVPLVSPGLSFYLKDLYDHTIQVIDTVETFRDILSGMLDIYLSSVSNRMNEIMKVLTIFAAIFIPLTFIAGLYGMNFSVEKSPWNMPELGWYFGYPFALGLMAITAMALLIFFKRKGWF